MPENFNVVRRNPGHWDIYDSTKRVFRLRGGPGAWEVYDERPSILDKKISPLMKFKEQSPAMGYICSEFMHELLTVEGDKPYVMGSWTVSRRGVKES